MFTLVALTGAPAVPATFQVTVWILDHVTAEFGEVTTNGPVFEFTVTCMSAVLTPPPPARLSRATTRKAIVRLVVGNISPAVVVLFNMSLNRGNVRDGLDEGLNERNKGLLPLSGVVRAIEGPRSRSSQQS